MFQVILKLLRMLRFIKGVQMRVSHIYREGNQAADFMANADREEGFWNYSILGLDSFLINDINCVGYCRDIC